MSTVAKVVQEALKTVTDPNFRLGEDQLQHLIWCDGMLTAAMIGPERSTPEEWLKLLSGSSTADDPEMVELLHGMHMRRADQLLTFVENRGPKFVPFKTRDCDELTALKRAEEWADGFFWGLHLRRSAWRPIFEDATGREAILPLLPFLKDREGNLIVPLPPGKHVPVRSESLPLLGEAVFKIHMFWQAQRDDAKMHGGRLGKVGRNEPCPCGSGEKYKRCCLN